MPDTPRKQFKKGEEEKKKKLNIRSLKAGDRGYIEGKLIKKYDVKEYQNQYGSGKFFCKVFEDPMLKDQIRCVAFNGAVEKFYEKLKVSNFFFRPSIKKNRKSTSQRRRFQKI